jgi:bis(5'-nucleosyl)-tetraphosphatase (symmetrical)
MSWRQALFIASARRRKHRASSAASSAASRPLLTGLLLGSSIGGSSFLYCYYAFRSDNGCHQNAAVVSSQMILRKGSNDNGGCLKQHAAATSVSLLATSSGRDSNSADVPYSKSNLNARSDDDDALKMSNTINTTSSSSTQTNNHQQSSSTRTYSTKADEYFQKNHRIPPPQIMHDNLDRLLQLHSEQRKEEENDKSDAHHPSTTAYNNNNNKILIIGDVHGCLTELKLLIEKATIQQQQQNNQFQNFRAIILVGDLVNKGPYSAEVIKFVRNQQQQHHNVFTVRGNHDDRALAAALGDEDCARKSTYDWITKKNEGLLLLSDEDVEWLAELPYTITIPSRLLRPQGDDDDENDESNQDVIVVHAGLLPNVTLDDQQTTTMTTIRDFLTIPPDDAVDDSGEQQTREHIAKAWKGPELVIFGHDAKRGLQQEEFAIGLDTGCVYGNQLSGIILPEREVVSVNALEVYSPINS